MQMGLINKLADELKEIGYKGSVVLCGYGEPMLHKNINIICKRLSEVSFVEPPPPHEMNANRVSATNK